MFCKENELFGEHECNNSSILEAQKTKKEKKLTKLTKTAFKH